MPQTVGSTWSCLVLVVLGAVVASLALWPGSPVAKAHADPVQVEQPEGSLSPLQDGDILLDGVHADIAARLQDGVLEMSVKDGSSPSNPVWRAPSDVVFVVGGEAQTTIPAASAFSFLGQPGGSVWILTQNNRPGLLWPGWNTEGVPASAVSGALTWRLLSVDGPGSFALFITDSFGGPSVLFNGRGALPASVSVAPGTHAHGNWAFGYPGIYRITFEFVARTPGGEELRAQEVLTFKVEGGTPEPSPTPTVAPTLPQTATPVPTQPPATPTLQATETSPAETPTAATSSPAADEPRTIVASPSPAVREDGGITPTTLPSPENSQLTDQPSPGEAEEDDANTLSLATLVLTGAALVLGLSALAIGLLRARRRPNG